MQDLFFYGTVFGISGFIWSVVLTKPGMIFGFVERWFWEGIPGCNYRALKIKEFISKALFTCYLCVAGQFALWGSLILGITAWLDLLACVSTSILVSWFLGRIKQWTDITDKINEYHQLRKRRKED